MTMMTQTEKWNVHFTVGYGEANQNYTKETWNFENKQETINYPIGEMCDEATHPQ